MRIGIDAFPFWEITGLGSYMEKLLKEWSHREDDDFFIFSHKQTPKALLISSPHYHYITSSLQPRNKLHLQWFEHVILPKLVRRHKIDVLFHAAFFNPLFVSCPKVLTLADAGYFFDKGVSLKNIFMTPFKKAALHAQSIVTLSHFAKQEIETFNPSLSHRIKVIPLAAEDPDFDTAQREKEAVFKKFSIHQPYFLFLGLIIHHKNIERILKAFRLFSEKHPSVQLVLGGSLRIHFLDVFQKIKELHLEDRVVVTDYLSDDEKKVFFAHAHAFIFPSLHEGFGIPVLEAQSYGIPVLTSNTTSLPEAAGKGALYVDPESVSDIAEGMRKIFEDQNLRRNLQEEGYRNKERFSWDNTADSILRIIKQVVHEKN